MRPAEVSHQYCSHNLLAEIITHKNYHLSSKYQLDLHEDSSPLSRWERVRVRESINCDIATTFLCPHPGAEILRLHWDRYGVAITSADSLTT